MLGPGAPVPDVRIWAELRAEPVPLANVLAGTPVLLCFYAFDWSPG
jgi:peroxiredoxin